MDPNLKPWHLKANYQLNDENNDSAEQGVFEYSWAWPNVYRSSWKRGESTHSKRGTADGKHFVQATGDPLSIYQNWLQSALLAPLPTAEELDPAKSILIDHSLALANAHSRCGMIVPAAIKASAAKTMSFALYPEYCVNKLLPIFLECIDIKGWRYTIMTGGLLKRPAERSQIQADEKLLCFAQKLTLRQRLQAI